MSNKDMSKSDFEAMYPYYKDDAESEREVYSEFGRGLSLCLVKFFEHGNDRELKERTGPGWSSLRSPGDMWYNASSDHMYELVVPDDPSFNRIRTEAEWLANHALSIGHGSKGCMSSLDLIQKDLKRAYSLITAIDEMQGCNIVRPVAKIVQLTGRVNFSDEDDTPDMFKNYCDKMSTAVRAEVDSLRSGVAWSGDLWRNVITLEQKIRQTKWEDVLWLKLRDDCFELAVSFDRAIGIADANRGQW